MISGAMITAGNLSSLEGVSHAFFTRQGGVSKGLYASLNCGVGSNDDERHVVENRGRAMARLGLDGDAVRTAYQVHGVAVIHAGHDWDEDARPQGDALVTTTPGVALGVLTADCAPVLLADPGAAVIAAVHAGWKGALAGVAEAAVVAMCSLGARLGEIRAAVGPCIGPRSYEVGPEFPAPFLADDPASRHLFRPAPRDGRFLFDLGGYVRARLARAGVTAIEASGHDTLAEEGRFFSYRRACLRSEGDYGRCLSAIALVP